jgi:hypothetical protein
MEAGAPHPQINSVLEPGLWIRIRIGSGFGLDPDSDWIRTRIGSGFSDFVDPDPYWKSRSGGKKMKKKILPLKRYKIALATF